MSRNPREDIRRKHRRQRRQVEWEWQRETMLGSLPLLTWADALVQMRRFIDRLPEVVSEMLGSVLIWNVVHRRYRNPWQSVPGAWWRV